MTMALAVFAAGSARANDATQVIYDLSALRAPKAARPATDQGSRYSVPMSSLPIATPGSEHRQDEERLDLGNEMELQQPNKRGRLASGVGAPRGGNDDTPSQPSPTPEPGTMLLLGSALASGARFVRRRRNA
jgi:hypothetical protein